MRDAGCGTRDARDAAYEPWTNWRLEAGEGPLALVRAAILAANPHNTQPWLFRVSDAPHPASRIPRPASRVPRPAQHVPAMQPLNQPVEMVDRERELANPPRWECELEAIVGDPAWRPTFAFRAGYPQREVPPSPRRPVDEVLMS